MTRRRLLGGVALAVGVLATTGCGEKSTSDGDKESTSDASGRTVRWKKTFEVALRAPISPTNLVAAGGRLYATHEGSLLAFDAATGNQLWTGNEGTVGIDNFRAPVVTGDTLLLLRRGDDQISALHAIDTATGALRWKYGEARGMEVQRWPAAAGEIACYSGIGNYAALDISNGRVLWSRESLVFGMAVPFGAPVMTADTIYLPDPGGTVAALDARTGERRWIAGGSDRYVTPSVLSLGGGLLLSAKDSRVTAFDAATGAQRWSTQFDGVSFAHGRPQIAGDTVVVTSNPIQAGIQHTVVALGLADGVRRWSFNIEGTIGDEAAIGDGVVYVPSKGALYALDLATGANRWTLRVANATFSPPAVSNGLVHTFALAPSGTYFEDTLYAVVA